MSLLDPFTRTQPERERKVEQTPLIDAILSVAEPQKKRIYHAGDICPWCHELGNRNRLKIRQGFTEQFLGCSRYPSCAFSTKP